MDLNELERMDTRELVALVRRAAHILEIPRNENVYEALDRIIEEEEIRELDLD